jgi:hypothetical protein
MRRLVRSFAIAVVAAACCAAAIIQGHASDPRGKPVVGARIRLTSGTGFRSETQTDAGGDFSFPAVQPGNYSIEAEYAGFVTLQKTVTAADDVRLNLEFTELAVQRQSVTVAADLKNAGILFPDPAGRVFVREETIDANPGRAGVPVSIPGLPAETASGGIKAPQYFAPGVAGDHGEPIAQYFQVGDYLLPNNLSANAHGNGYADPNIVLAAAIETVAVDGGAFNAREGNHSVDLAAIYGFRERIEPFVTLTGDSRDIDLTAGWSRADPGTKAWVAVEVSYGNGFLKTLEHRQQYRVNGYRVFDAGTHQVTLFGTGYFGQSRIPGLVPIDVPSPNDTIDPRQREQTHAGEMALDDRWRPAEDSEIHFAGSFRTYNLALYSNFGDGLIRQSEFRTATGGESTYTRKVREYLTVVTGIDYSRDAPRRLDLDHYNSTNPAIYGPFQHVMANDVTIASITPFAAIEGKVKSWLGYYAGWRRDEIGFDNADLLRPVNSLHQWAGVNSPKASLTLAPPQTLLPEVSFSFGQSFFTNDPRIGTAAGPFTPVSRAHSYQAVVSKTIAGTDFRVTLRRTTQEQTLAKLDPDTGLPFAEGPSRNRNLTVSARHYFRGGLLEASLSKADARDLATGLPVPEAPRTIYDVLGTIDRLPFRV